MHKVKNRNAKNKPEKTPMINKSGCFKRSEKQS